MSNAPDGNEQVQYCTVTHPFHTLYGKKIQIISLKRSWDEYKVFYHQDDGRLISIPACWTSSYGPDIFNFAEDVQFTVHSLRHSHIMHYTVDKGVPLPIVQKQVGLRSPTLLIPRSLKIISIANHQDRNPANNQRR